MVNSWTGKWFAEKDYSIFDAKDVCYMDKIAMVVIDIIKDTDYKVKTTIENICYMILNYLENDDRRGAGAALRRGH